MPMGEELDVDHILNILVGHSTLPLIDDAYPPEVLKMTSWSK